MNTVTFDDFVKSQILFFSQMKKTGIPVMITDKGMNLAEIHPPSISGKRHRRLGSMRESVKIVGDIISSVSPESDWEALRD